MREYYNAEQTSLLKITKTGKLLRRFSLDEIPQLLNVLKGEMSLVGPRPLLPEYLLIYSPEQIQRHSVKPGITGWAQVHFMKISSWNEVFLYDIYYVRNISFALDLRIIGLTFLYLLRKKGINDSMELQEKFSG